MNGFLSPDEVAELGLTAYGDDVLIDRAARIYGADRIALGNHVRIDAYCVLSAGAGGIAVGDYVHVSAFAFMAGAGRIEIGDFSNVSGRVSIYSSNDDYSGAAMVGAVVPDELRNVTHAPVTIGRHVVVGAGTVILPGVTLGEGAAVGALSLVRRDVPAFTIVGGVDRVLGKRRRDVLELEQQLR